MFLFLKIFGFVLVTFLVTLTACGRPALSLSPNDDVAYRHFADSIAYSNQFKVWMNRIANLPQERHPPESEWKSNLSLLKNAITEAKSVSPDFLLRAHGNLPLMWTGYFIPSMEKIYEYYSEAVENPSLIKLPSTSEGMQQLKLLTEGRLLDDIFWNWYDSNRNPSVKA